MRTGASLALIGIGAILAFAVTANTSVFNLHTAGYVCMIIGLIGLYLRSRGWVGRQILVRRTRSLRGNLMTDPDATPPQGMPAVPRIDDDRQPVPTFSPEAEIVEEQEYRPD